jgi:hypothetical protein
MHGLVPVCSSQNKNIQSMCRRPALECLDSDVASGREADAVSLYTASKL